jgi:hypothetical protein
MLVTRCGQRELLLVILPIWVTRPQHSPVRARGARRIRGRLWLAQLNEECGCSSWPLQRLSGRGR